MVATVSFTCFTKVKLLALSNQQACGSTPWLVCFTRLLVALHVSSPPLRRLRCVPVPMHSLSVVSRNPHDKCAADGNGAINRLYPPGSRSVTHLDLGVN